MTLRTIATPLTIGTFIVVCFTGLCMLFGVHGLVNPIHEVTSVLFVVGSVLHIAINWRPTLAYLKKPLGASLAIVFTVISLVALLPTGGKGQNPRQVLGQASDVILDSNLPGVATLTKQSEQTLLGKLAQAGFASVDSQATLRDIARANGKSTLETLAAVLPKSVNPGGGQGH